MVVLGNPFFRWLHLTDLHLGMAEQASLWPNVEEIFLKDLKGLFDRIGPWDAVLISGDITQKGAEAEFKEVDNLLLKLWTNFKEWGFTPAIFAIPGNHDLARPQNKDDPALVTLLRSWDAPEVQKPFWGKTDSPQRQVITNAFQAYTNWWENTPILKPASFTKGLLPGDGSATFEVNGFKVGVIGLNSAYLQLAEGDF